MFQFDRNLKIFAHQQRLKNSRDQKTCDRTKPTRKHFLKTPYFLTKKANLVHEALTIADSKTAGCHPLKMLHLQPAILNTQLEISTNPKLNISSDLRFLNLKNEFYVTKKLILDKKVKSKRLGKDRWM